MARPRRSADHSGRGTRLHAAARPRRHARRPRLDGPVAHAALVPGSGGRRARLHSLVNLPGRIPTLIRMTFMLTILRTIWEWLQWAFTALLPFKADRPIPPA